MLLWIGRFHVGQHTQPTAHRLNGWRLITMPHDACAKRRGFCCHAVLDPVAGDPGDVGKARRQAKINPLPFVFTQKEIERVDTGITGQPRTIDDQGNGDAIGFPAARY
jgi:hypothetical protein